MSAIAWGRDSAPPPTPMTAPVRAMPPRPSNGRVGDRGSVVDLAAGTGKLTAALVRPGRQVTAIELSEGMIAVLRANLPGVDARIASAEATGLPDAFVEAVVIGSALNWFDRPAADREIARIFGRVGSSATSTTSATDVPWVAALDEFVGSRPSMQAVRQTEVVRQDPLDPSLFTPAETAELPFTHVMNADLLAGLFASRSAVIDL